MIQYWHWHTLHFGAETYWGGILPHNGMPGRVYHELAALGAELERAGDLVAQLAPDADVAFLYDNPSKWALQGHPPLATADGGPDTRSYERIFDAFYRGAFDAGLQARILHPGQLPTAELPPVLVVPAYYAAADEILDRLKAYAERGGHLVLGPRTAYADTEARARTDAQPARLADAAEVTYDEFSNLGEPLPVTGTAGLALPAEAHALHWADGLRPQGAETLATYRHPHFGRWPAATTSPHGSGRITCVGTVPAPSFARALLNWAAPKGTWRPSHASVTCTAATARDGRRVRFLHNWSWETVTMALPRPLRDVLSDHVHEISVRLGPWDVRIFEEQRP
jgi:beta-galactosidase